MCLSYINFSARRDTQQLWCCYRCQEGAGRFRNYRKKKRHEYFPKPIYGSSKLQPDTLCRPSLQLMVAENIHHHRRWCCTALSLCCFLKLHLEREGQTRLSLFHTCLPPCSLYHNGLDCQAVLNCLELIFHLDAPCQYKSIDTEAQKNRLHPMPPVCFVYWELFFFFQGECKTFISIYFPCRL